MRALPLLSPRRRDLLMDALRPPSGYELDRAVGTCFSLDLNSALLVPLAFALFDWESSEEGEGDPAAVLAAAQTQAEKMSIYCEAGRIAPAVRAPKVIAYLEGSLRTVVPPSRGAFHPKVWVLRFTPSDDGGDAHHRVLCLSRNLTFDRSWDTIVRLEQAPQGEIKDTKPLVRFLRYLDELSPSEHARELAASVAKVAFVPPAGFDGLALRPLLPGKEDDPLVDGGDRLLIVSPFIDQARLEKLASRWNRLELASRPETLDRVEPEVLNSLAGVFAFDSLDQAEPTPTADERVAEAIGLSGLHAKIHCGSSGSDGLLLIGSANSTTAAFERNVEFCVELRGPAGRIGPKRLIEERKDGSTLRALLQPYPVGHEVTEKSEQERELERLDEIRRELAALRLVLHVRREGADGPWTATLRANRRPPSLKGGDSLRCWPVTLSPGSAAQVSDDRKLGTFTFQSLANVIPLFTFALTARMKGVPEVRFTLLTALLGDVKGRLEAVFGETLRDPERFVRFLLLLLASGRDDDPGLISELGTSSGNGARGGESAFDFQIPLLESLVRAFARDPGRLAAFRTAIRHLRSAQRHGVTVPEGLLEVWEPVEAALAAREVPDR